MVLINRTRLDSDRLQRMLQQAVAAWPHDNLTVQVRYSRGADYSGTFVRSRRVIYVNVARHLNLPYRLETYVARARSNRTHWWKPMYCLQLTDPCQLVLFVFLHEFYHWLIARARRNSRQKESMCDRFAVRGLVELAGLEVRDAAGRRVQRSDWDFQDLDGFVARARPKRQRVTAPRTTSQEAPRQMWLFDVA